MVLSCTDLAIKRDIGRKSRYFHTHLHSTSPLGGGDSCRTITAPFGVENQNGQAIRWWKTLTICVAVSTEYRRIPACDRQTDRRLATT